MAAHLAQVGWAPSQALRFDRQRWQAIFSNRSGVNEVPDASSKYSAAFSTICSGPSEAAGTRPLSGHAQRKLCFRQRAHCGDCLLQLCRLKLHGQQLRRVAIGFNYSKTSPGFPHAVRFGLVAAALYMPARRFPLSLHCEVSRGLPGTPRQSVAIAGRLCFERINPGADSRHRRRSGKADRFPAETNRRPGAGAPNLRIFTSPFEEKDAEKCILDGVGYIRNISFTLELLECICIGVKVNLLAQNLVVFVFRKVGLQDPVLGILGWFDRFAGCCQSFGAIGRLENTMRSLKEDAKEFQRTIQSVRRGLPDRSSAGRMLDIDTVFFQTLRQLLHTGLPCKINEV